MRNDALYVEVTPGKVSADRNSSVIDDVCMKLSQAISVRLLSEVCLPGWFYRSGLETSRISTDTEWTAFRLYKAMIDQNPNIHHGATVFDGTRVPIHTLIHYIKSGASLDEFLEGFPSVSRKQAIEFLEFALTSAIEAYAAQREPK